jgi:asparagine synthetase B (glutamine-hydrolysing)
MSGLVVGFGKPDPVKIEKMFTKINYRGPYLAGVCKNKKVIMAQNYLKADCPQARPEKDSVPVADVGGEQNYICYDGQMGNINDLANTHGIFNGPFKEDRLILHLF